jgi:hypothetical protein
MSIGLFIGYRDPRKEDRLVSIASDDCFIRYWTPVCQSLHLRWVPRFPEGWRLTTEDIPHIISELERFQRFLLAERMHEDVTYQQLARISVLNRELNEAYTNIYAIVFIGSPFRSERRTSIFPNSKDAPLIPARA